MMRNIFLNFNRKFSSYLETSTSSHQLRFDGRVVVITGGGRGLGKAYSKLFAARGAFVVVNDFGGSRSGDGKGSENSADVVVDEIIKMGGKAVPNYESVTNGEKIVQTAIKNFGKIDILINNAGILRDRSFINMSDEDWNSVNEVHLHGSYKCTRAAWPYFLKQKYGRIINTSSVAGLLGNFGQANYSTAKAGLLGLTSCLAKEGSHFNIHANTIVPVAGSRITKDVLPPDLYAALKPELIASVVGWLCHEDCEDNGVIIETAAGFASRYVWQRSGGTAMRNSSTDPVLIETVRDNWPQITDMLTNPDNPHTPEGAMLKLMKSWRGQETGQGDQSDFLISKSDMTTVSFPNVKHDYKVNDVILYALGLGVHLNDKDGRRFLYENDQNFGVLPTFSVIPAVESFYEALKYPSLNINFTKVLHGEQYVELLRPMPTEAELTMKTEVVDVLDKKSGCVYILRVTGEDDDQRPIFVSESLIFEVDAGGFGGKKESEKLVTKPLPPPNREPDAILEFKIDYGLASLYRLNGDANPHCINQKAAEKCGFNRPILHGLCTYGIAVRLILQKYADSNPNLFKCAKARFSKPVYPGDTLLVSTWDEGLAGNRRIPYEVKTKDQNGKTETVISGGYVDFIGKLDSR